MELSFAQKGEHDPTEMYSTSKYSNLRTRFAKKLFFAKNAFARSVQSYPRQFRATSNLSLTFRPLILPKKCSLCRKSFFEKTKERVAFRKMVFMTQHNATQKASLSTPFAQKQIFHKKFVSVKIVPHEFRTDLPSTIKAVPGANPLGIYFEGFWVEAPCKHAMSGLWTASADIYCKGRN